MGTTGLFTIHDLILKGIQDPGRNAIESPGLEPLTYHDLRIQIQSVVQYLHAQGFRCNDRIAIISSPGPDTAVCIVSVMAGFTSVPLNPQNREREFDRLFSRLGIRAVIVCGVSGTAAVATAKKGVFLCLK